MYRSRNRGRGSGAEGIKGPNSALTQFLREEGISAEVIRDKWQLQQNKNDQKPKKLEELEDSDKEAANRAKYYKKSKKEDDDEQEEEELDLNDGEISSDEDSSYKRKLRLTSADSDEEEYESADTSMLYVSTIQRKSARLNPDDPTVQKRKQEVLTTRKRKRMRASNLLNRKTNKLPTLQSLCINKISNNILKLQKESDDNKVDNTSSLICSKVRDALGGISTENLSSLSNALSKNRALNDNTLQLFLKTELISLAFHDCSRVSFEGYKSLAIFSPHIKELSLQMCGQLNNESLLYIAEKLTNLTSLKLDGPFLINEATWDEFFKIMKGRLQIFHVSNTHRFTDASLSSLLTNCSSSLVSLGLSRLDSVFNYSLLPQYLTNQKFHTLSIQYPYNEDDVSDEVVINILGQVGSSIKSITLDGCLGLTDSMIINGLCAFLASNCKLETLSLSELDQITSDSLVYLFSQVSMPKLTTCNFRRCVQLGDMVLVELLLNKARESLVALNINSLKELTSEVFCTMNCPNLEYIDLGFVRCVNDKSIETIGNQNPKLKLMDVFGDNLVTPKAIIRKGLTITGRQNDNI